MIKISYDRDANEFHMQNDEPPVNWKRSVEDALTIVGGIVQAVRFEHGRAASEALLEMVRRMDEASVFSLVIEDGDADEASKAEKDMDRRGGSRADGACARSGRQLRSGQGGDDQGGRPGNDQAER